ncbi:hypothetical protein A5623_13625 [Mycobacterium colombiense]|uniref:Uncharacterized protein n=1 Tax=Mycobacterium colombiense TaxID=339268 RepID=A0A853M6N2_9MYCO|nr:hypothetical protein A5623_13625 [Mycobacterium colombiense]OBJ62387.1 hypothetical protein A5628_02930 [Mycobacterium colombiense]
MLHQITRCQPTRNFLERSPKLGHHPACTDDIHVIVRQTGGEAMGEKAFNKASLTDFLQTCVTGPALA